MERRATCTECADYGCKPDPEPEPRPVLRLVSNVSMETVAYLRDLLEAAEAGHLRGLICGEVYQGSRYSAAAVGNARQNPTLARGIIAKLDDELAKMV